MMNVFGMLTATRSLHTMPFIGFVTLLTIGYIANSYYAERVVQNRKDEEGYPGAQCRIHLDQF